MSSSESTRPVVIVGLPRSGSTWVANVVGSSPGARLVVEPDNAKEAPAALPASRRLGRYPILERGEAAPRYRRVWAAALSGSTHPVADAGIQRLWGAPTSIDREALVSGRPRWRQRGAGWLAYATATTTHRAGGERRVVKSVHAALALDWLSTSFDVSPLVVLRHPANVLASWLELRLPDADRELDRDDRVIRRWTGPWSIRPPAPDAVSRAAWHIGLLLAVLEDAAGRHPDWTVVTHEELCADPTARFERVFHQLRLPWGRGVEATLHDSDRDGSGFAVARRASEQAQRWRRRLDRDQLEHLVETLSSFPLQRWHYESVDDLLERG